MKRTQLCFQEHREQTEHLMHAKMERLGANAKSNESHLLEKVRMLEEELGASRSKYSELEERTGRV